MKVTELYAWLHDNPFYPHRRRQSLWYGIQYMQGEQLVNFARYALSISYAFSRNDQQLTAQLLQKAGLKVKGSTQNGISGIGQQADEVPGVPMGEPDEVPGVPMGDDSDFPSWMNGLDDAMVDDGMNGQIPGLGSGASSQGGNVFGSILGSFAGGLLKGALGSSQPGSQTGAPPVGTRQGDMVWNGAKWVYSPATPKPGTTAQAPTASETAILRNAGRLTVGLRTATGWTWTGSGWVPSSQYLAPGTIPAGSTPAGSQPTSSTSSDNTIPIMIGFGLLAAAAMAK